MVGAVGDDGFGVFLRGELEKSGLDLRFVKTGRFPLTPPAFPYSARFPGKSNNLS